MNRIDNIEDSEIYSQETIQMIKLMILALDNGDIKNQKMKNCSAHFSGFIEKQEMFSYLQFLKTKNFNIVNEVKGIN